MRDGQKHKTGECKRNEKRQKCPFELNKWIHGFYKRKKPERFKKMQMFYCGNRGLPDVGKTRQLVEAIRRKRESPIRIPETPTS